MAEPRDREEEGALVHKIVTLASNFWFLLKPGLPSLVGKIELVFINQSVSAFNHILSDFSLIVYQFQAISAFSAIIDRLGEFDDALEGNFSQDNSTSDDSAGIKVQLMNLWLPCALECNGSVHQLDTGRLLEVCNLTLQTPSSDNILIEDLSFKINDRDHLLIVGPSGSGKTSLLRALAGLWTNGQGTIIYVKDSNRQQVSILGLIWPLGTLRQQLLYPTWSEASHPDDHCMPTSEDLANALMVVSLGDLLSRFHGLDSTYEWSSVLSLGEQQRLAFARLLLSKPKLVLLDESTSALDETNEARLYHEIEAAGITYISIGHRSTLFKYHNTLLHISKFDIVNNRQNWQLKPITQEAILPDSILNSDTSSFF
ncbi:hypothetical protein HPP92_021380 [Vanilla planifolia]|uniref:ABC transporter domain-containing protein n=1 Tax=Vanilla planifolia TaxID=51239 RepID=A0A835PZR1_VANPL|nr:hypothetical protein HPP92_021380 [Vanilla planifolia]